MVVVSSFFFPLPSSVHHEASRALAARDKHFTFSVLIQKTNVQVVPSPKYCTQKKQKKKRVDFVEFAQTNKQQQQQQQNDGKKSLNCGCIFPPTRFFHKTLTFNISLFTLKTKANIYLVFRSLRFSVWRLFL